MTEPAGTHDTDDGQAEVRAFLAGPAGLQALGQPGAAVQTVRTHISWIVLAGDRACKLKRAVRLPYVDFSTPQRRLRACLHELELNRRTAPALYLRVRRITREPGGGLAFDGAGELVDAVLEMVRFDGDLLLDRVARRGGLTPALAEALALRVARFHADAQPTEADGAAPLAAVLDLNERAFAQAPAFAPQEAAALNRSLRGALDRLAPLLRRRAAAGRVRHCHGDLHLGNICLVDGEPTLFDCIEFDDALATIDVLYDLAFLLMDLRRLGRAQIANFVFNRYLDETGDTDGLAALPFFMALRAAIRAHVTAQRIAPGPEGEETAERAAAYVALGRELLEPAPAGLVAIGGFSGSGKSTVAAAVADRLGPAPGARVLSSDRVRKRMHGVAAQRRLPAAAYRPEVSQAVYEAMAEQAAGVLAQGHAVVMDAVFDREPMRALARQCAARLGLPFAGVWLQAPRPVLAGRIATRRNDPSDATVDVLQSQLARAGDTPAWTPVAADAPADEVARRVLAALGAGD